MVVKMRIRTLRKEAGYSLRELAKIVGVQHPSVCKWEQGTQYPSADKLPMLAVALHCEIGDLYEHQSPGGVAS